MSFSYALRRMLGHLHYGFSQLRYGLILAPLGKGEPLSKAQWNSRYEEGYSEKQLSSLNDFARYMIIAGYIHLLGKTPAVLDIGCGDGILVGAMPDASFEAYLGIDLSEEAIRKANARALQNAQFEVGNFEDWMPKQNYDVIVFNETLYYAKDPLALVERYAGCLKEGGMIIVSMCRFLHHPLMLWRNLEKVFDTVDSTVIKTHKGELYNVKVLARSQLH